MKDIDEIITTFLLSSIVMFCVALFFIFADRLTLNINNAEIISLWFLISLVIYNVIKKLNIEMLKDISERV